ncbi:MULTISPECIES: sporulation YhaL family protein [Fictibacillus]|uniref:sporulation YhaL family protein n=1 Tax=Fictibacillus TaxID=1329200 RepID=UPI00041C6452
MKRYGTLLLGVVLVALFFLKAYINPLEQFFAITPWWVYIVFAGILLSGYMSYTIRVKEVREEERLIEQEGEIYMRRIAEAREKRKNS